MMSTCRAWRAWRGCACGVGAWVLVVWVWVRCGCVVSVGVRAVWVRGVAVLWSNLAQVAVECVEVLPVEAWLGSGLGLGLGLRLGLGLGLGLRVKG